MATVTRVNGATAAMEQVGRDIVWLKRTGDISAAADLEATTKAIAQYCTVTIIGTPASGGTIFGVEGFPASVPADLETALDAIVTGTLSIVTITGVTFA
jgi:ABC-type sugar transport system substrate-binding protein